MPTTDLIRRNIVAALFSGSGWVMLPASPAPHAADEANPPAHSGDPVAGADSARHESSARLLEGVERAWRQPARPPAPPVEESAGPARSPIAAKLSAIVLPVVSFSGMELSRVVNTLSAVSEEFDHSGTTPRGVNVVLLDPGNLNPEVTITLRNLPLNRVLDFITDAVGFQYEVQPDAVVVRPAGGPPVLETRFFPVSSATAMRLAGKTTASNTGPAGDLLAGRPPAPAPSTAVGEGTAIQNFLQQAGVVFDGVPGASLAFDGSQLIVTQTPRNLERVRRILDRYATVRQVEIEAKFMEVQQGVLEEMGIQWNVATKASQQIAGARATYSTGNGVNRTLNSAFSFQNGAQSLQISAPATADSAGTSLALPVNAPVIPETVSLGSPAAALADITGVIGEFDVNAVVRALSQKSGTELLSAPRLTVLSGSPATITVAQEMRYPQSYGQIQSQVGTGSASGGGSAGVSITSGTPQAFATRNVGVELRVTPTVEEDDRSISLDLNPKVTEFEGFVEYGGPSVAISGGTTVTVPPGFYQPIFGVRELTTRVTLWDGATLVMGGLTREEVKKVKDKVPVLGSLPLVGRLFRSEGESSQKRNLLIFVTARLVGPGGAPQNPPPAAGGPVSAVTEPADPKSNLPPGSEEAARPTGDGAPKAGATGQLGNP